jgi:hypothetical protein
VTTGPQDPASRDRLRAGHADRDLVIEALKTAFVDGRLTKTELTARTGRALAARTHADLASAALSAADPPGGMGGGQPPMELGGVTGGLGPRGKYRPRGKYSLSRGRAN